MAAREVNHGSAKGTDSGEAPVAAHAEPPYLPPMYLSNRYDDTHLCLQDHQKKLNWRKKLEDLRDVDANSIILSLECQFTSKDPANLGEIINYRRYLNFTGV